MLQLTHALSDTTNVYHCRGTPLLKFGKINMPSIGCVVGFPYLLVFTCPSIQCLKCNLQLKIKSPVQRSRVTTDWWPRQTNSSRPSTMFQRRIVLSADAVRTESSQSVMQVTRASCPLSSSSGSHGSSPCGDHTRTKPSWPPVATTLDSSSTLRH